MPAPQKIIADTIAAAPEWVRRELTSTEPSARVRAEETLAAMIASAVLSNATT